MTSSLPVWQNILARTLTLIQIERLNGLHVRFKVKHDATETFREVRQNSGIDTYTARRLL